jgi:hypothetical protein
MTTTLSAFPEPARARCGPGRRASSASSPPGRGQADFPHIPLRQFHRRELLPSIGTPAEEAAWQVLKPFIDPADCNQWVTYIAAGELIEGVRAMNTNACLEARYNHERLRLRYFGKGKLVQHCRGLAKYYYRGRWNGVASTGYGGHANAWQKLRFDAAPFAMDGRKVTYPAVQVLLLGFDVDCHHGEKDVARTTDLILELFPGTYHEPSTNSLGRHLYVKLYYRHDGDRRAALERIRSLTGRLAAHIEAERRRRGYDAALDGIRGLPSLVEVERDAGGAPRTHSVTLADGSTIQAPSLRVAWRSPVIKIPFYRNCSMDEVSRFFAAPWYDVEQIDDILDAAGKAAPDNLTLTTSPPPKGNSPEDAPTTTPQSLAPC